MLDETAELHLCITVMTRKPCAKRLSARPTAVLRAFLYIQHNWTSAVVVIGIDGGGASSNQSSSRISRTNPSAPKISIIAPTI